MVLAAGYGSGALAVPSSPQDAPRLALQPIRGQTSWGLHGPGTAEALPAFPVNGHGSLIPALPLKGSAGKFAWVTGASYERDNASTDIRAEDQRHNFSKLQTLLPASARQLQAQFDSERVHAWAGVRCATPSRLPSLGPLAGMPGVWVCSGMGSRGLTFAALCGELLAARLHGEPLPLEQRQADALLPQYAAR